MAYRRRSSRSRSGYSRRSSGGRSYSRRTSRRSGGRSASGGTMRLVIEHVTASPVSRPGLVPAAPSLPGKAKL